MKRPVFLLVLGFFVSACGEPTTNRIVTLDGCTSLRAQGDLDLVLEANTSLDAAPQMELLGTQDALDAVTIEQASEHGRLGRVDVRAVGPSTVVLRLSCPDLDTLELLGAVNATHGSANTSLSYAKIAVYGSSQFTAQMVAADVLDLRSAGSARIDIEQLSAETLQVLMSGSSHVEVRGDTALLKADLSGSTVLAASQLRAQTVEMKAAGASQATVFATAHLKANLRSQAQLTYWGAPDLTIDKQDQATVSAH